MLLLTQSSHGALAPPDCSLPRAHLPKSSVCHFHSAKSRFSSIPFHRSQRRATVQANAQGEGNLKGTSQFPVETKQSAQQQQEPVLVKEDSVPLEGVIQFEKPGSSLFSKWGRIGLLSAGDVLCLLVFAAIGRWNHGLPVFEAETLQTADPFIAGWFLSAYFLGGYGPDGRGTNGLQKAVLAAAKSWAGGIPLGLIIRASTSGHIPPTAFILVSAGSTAVLLIGWRTLLNSQFPDAQAKGTEQVYKRGNPFELFELLTSLVRRW
ncbi:hypothetical protein EJ110_NYTH12043 [Nymphaea thermarum]|nr:hypothetical protein EJ110_NYTH12043 [Nymphaea thermarum]